MTGDGDFDDDGFRYGVVDRRRDLREAEGVVNECEEAPTTATRTILPKNCVARELWQARVISKFCLLDASDNDIVTREEMVKFRRRVLKTIAIPANDTFGGRRRSLTTTRLSLWSRVRVNAPNEEEDEDEKSRKVIGEDEKEDDEPVEEERRHHTGLIPPRGKGVVGRVGCDFDKSDPPRTEVRMRA